jgi:hypothetical protein
MQLDHLPFGGGQRVANPACRLEKNPLAGLEAKRRWGPTEQQGFPIRLAGWKRTHWRDSKRSGDGARQNSKGSQSGLPVGKEPTGGTRSEAEMGPARTARVANPAYRLEKNPLTGLEAKRSWGPTASTGVCSSSKHETVGSVEDQFGIVRSCLT